MNSLRKVFAPQSVAVIGASETPGKVGAIALRNLRAAGFSGPIYPVHPRLESVQGLRAYGDVRQLPGPVDLAVVCTPAATVPPLVQQCGAAGVGGMVILTAGFREAGAEGQALEAALRQEARAFPQMRIVGPNCLGLIVPGAQLNASFAASMPAAGRVAFVSQSGALCTAVLDWARDEAVGFSSFVSMGNMVDVDMADMLDHLSEDPTTGAIILYIESIEHARAFMSAARACARTKPIIAYKAGRFAESAKAAASHTGAMAGVDSVYEAALERAGIVRVFDIKEMFQCAEMLAKGPRVAGSRLAIVTNAGGPGVMACDALLARQGTLAQLAPETLARLDAMLPRSWSRGNPVDVLGDATPERYAQALEVVVDDPDVDAVVAILTPQGMTDPTQTARAVADVATQRGKPIIATWMGAELVREGVHLLNAAGVTTAATPDDAVAGFMQLVRYRRNLEILYETPRDVPLRWPFDRQATRSNLLKLLAGPREILYESEAKAFLSAYGIPVAESRAVRSADEAALRAADIGFPVVLKVVSPEITHKTDVGGVELNLSNPEDVRAAYERIVASVARLQPTATIEAVAVQPMITLAGGMELIIGAKKDPVFGPVIMAGLGGIAAEIFHDRALGLPPLNERLAMHMLESLRCWPLVQGYRGRKPVANPERIVEMLLRFSYLVSDFPEIAEFDANPVLVRGDEVVALDARLVVDRRAVAEGSHVPYAHLAIRPYPSDLVQPAQLSDGTPIVIRPIRPEDEPMWRALLAECSHETLWSRFRFSFKVDTHEAAVRFCFVDYDRELTAVAEVEVAGQRRLLGVARLVCDVDTGRAEFAVLVGDAWQGKGLGTLLTKYCLNHADRTRVKRITADTGRMNTRMIKIFKHFGFDLEPAGDATLLQASKAL
jgi:acetyltransferase